MEAGERLGFLPGDMREKVDPYLRPLYDSLYDLLDFEKIQKKIEVGDIEIAPLAFMRGRTLKNSFAILDEAQNATDTQIKMFLTRIGENSKIVVNGDPSQIDLINKNDSGLLKTKKILEDVRAQLEIAGFYELKSQKFVLTGGTSQTPGLDTLASRILGQQVRIGRPLRIHRLPQAYSGPTAFLTNLK